MTARAMRMGGALGAVLAIWVAALGAATTLRQPVVTAAATCDLTVTSLGALYLIAVRGGHLPRWTLRLALALGLAATRLWLLPQLDTGRAALALAGTVELAALAWLLVRARTARVAWRAARAAGLASVDAGAAAAAAVGIPRALADGLATELAIVATALLGWRRASASPARFTLHRSSGWSLTVAVLVVLLAVEGALLHLVLALFVSPTAAWIASGLGAYSALWLVGDAHALRHGGVVMAADGLHIRLGLRWRCEVRWSAIAAIAAGPSPADALRLTVARDQAATVALHLRAPIVVRGWFGRRRSAAVLALAADDPDGLCAAVTRRTCTPPPAPRT